MADIPKMVVVPRGTYSFKHICDALRPSPATVYRTGKDLERFSTIPDYTVSLTIRYVGSNGFAVCPNCGAEFRAAS